MSDSDLCDLTLRSAARRLANREISSSELTTAILERIEEVQPTFHPYVTIAADRALSDARRADAELAKGERRGPLHGIPVAIKDSFDTAGIPTEGGSRARRGRVPAEDSAAAERLRRAGAVLLGKSVTEECVIGVISAPTRCAWDSERIPGGSSGGSAVAVALDAAIAAVGSDTGGSVRIPASLNGIVAMKPTAGRISKFGTMPVSWSLDAIGPMAKTSWDCALLLGELAGYDSRDPTSASEPVPDYVADIDTGLSGLRVGVPTGYLFEEIAPDIEGQVREAIGALEASGAHLVPVTTPLAEYAVAANTLTWIPEAGHYHREGIRHRADLYGPAVRLFLELGQLCSAADYLQAVRVRGLIKCAMRQVFADNDLDILVTPTLAVGALRADEVQPIASDDDRQETFGGYTRTVTVFNETGQPALTLPCGFDDDGIPCGLQIVGRPFDEATVLRAGVGFEAVTEWHARKPLRRPAGHQP